MRALDAVFVCIGIGLLYDQYQKHTERTRLVEAARVQQQGIMNRLGF